jgi:hypothetical protein
MEPLLGRDGFNVLISKRGLISRNGAARFDPVALTFKGIGWQ